MKWVTLFLLVCVSCFAGCEKRKKEPIAYEHDYGCRVTYTNKSACKKVCETRFYHIDANTMGDAKAESLFHYENEYPDSKPKVISCWDCSTRILDAQARETCAKASR
ncbi:MAG: hypothetical protein WCW31_05135 [Patescibacteria group bacterium]